MRHRTRAVFAIEHLRSADLIVVKQGRPVRLDFYRDESASCSEQVMFGDFGIVKDLFAFQTTPIEFTPD
ncbi:MAG: hypothetical protein ABJC26_16280 [Gemmatimonadaceae bacterium]